MSITPFLPGLPAPVPVDGTPAATDQPGDLGVVFGDALAAALLATVPLPAAPATAPSVPATAATPPAAAAPAAAAVLAVATPTAPAAPAAPAAPSAPAPTAHLTNGASEPMAVPAPARAVAPLPLSADVPTDVPTDAPDPAPADIDTLADTDLPAPAPTTGSVTPPLAAAPRPTVAQAVVQQVFPEVAHLVATTPTDRPGTHRITLTLQPEQLGEVRVTLVVKDGTVQVRLAGSADDAAGSAAVHRALSSGVPELQRLLERSGATEAKVLVRDPFNPAPPQPTTPSAPVAATGQTSGSTVSADAGRDGASGWTRSSGDPDRRREQRDVPEPAPALTPTPTTPAGQLDRTL
ncbi:flagellar hook-length control protein FliK [Nocardioides nitrophenolicus]|uniref:flagellar hook-length control protein FliK n=1 Tax=Nocardioides nitrophenolicus TaxID=60489 RepID=UPI00195E340D|nr:flagellar hook-length control protein FliK [Nocardioides nitrophenolicus]MBM7516413.1 flagellar hook-length control protein FliK [Nocardioides nitrophenolicus]